jgi:hypothetical protein
MAKVNSYQEIQDAVEAKTREKETHAEWDDRDRQHTS